jgi:hypothetical protein
MRNGEKHQFPVYIDAAKDSVKRAAMWRDDPPLALPSSTKSTIGKSYTGLRSACTRTSPPGSSGAITT